VQDDHEAEHAVRQARAAHARASAEGRAFTRVADGYDGATRAPARPSFLKAGGDGSWRRRWLMAG